MFDRESESKKTLRLLMLIAVPVAVAGLLVVSLYAWNFHAHTISLDPTRWGVFGDFFGGVLNPVVATAALVALLYGVYLQRTELVETKLALRSQAETMEAQLFDSKFFGLISMYNDSISKVSYVKSSRETVFGYEALRECLHEFLYKARDIAEIDQKQEGDSLGYEVFILLNGYSNYYLGTATPLMVVNRVFQIAYLIKQAKVEQSAQYHSIFSAYVSEEVKV